MSSQSIYISTCSKLPEGQQEILAPTKNIYLGTQSKKTKRQLQGWRISIASLIIFQAVDDQSIRMTCCIGDIGQVPHQLQYENAISE